MQWWGNAEAWQKLPATSRAAAMALLEADSAGGRPDMHSAKNALGAMLNRSQKEGTDLGRHVSQPIYQPTLEPAQFMRLQRIVNSPEHKELVKLAEMRQSGMTPDWVGGSTHFLAPEQRMVGHYMREPDKYHNWGPFKNSAGKPGQNWTGYDPKTGSYKNVVMRDKSHTFLAPGGAHSANYGYDPENEAAAFADRPNPSAFTKPGSIPSEPVPPAKNGDPSVAQPMALGGPKPGFDPSQYAKLEIGAKRSQLMAKLLTDVALDPSTPKSHLEGFSRVVAALVGGHQASKEDKLNLDRRAELAAQLSGIPNQTPSERIAGMSGNPDTVATALSKRDAPIPMSPDQSLWDQRAGKPIATAPSKGKEIGISDGKKLEEEGAKLRQLSALKQSFNPAYGGYGSQVIGDLANMWGRNAPDSMVSKEMQDASNWWQGYKVLENQVRHGLFGSALTATERDEWLKATIHPGMNPKQIAHNLERQAEVADAARTNKARGWSMGGYNPAQVAQFYGTTTQELGLPERKLKEWKLYQDPAVPGQTPAAPGMDGAPPAPTPAPAAVRPLPPAEHAEALDQARAAIKAGKDPEAVKARLKQLGIDPGAL